MHMLEVFDFSKSIFKLAAHQIFSGNSSYRKFGTQTSILKQQLNHLQGGMAQRQRV
jgi:hypothetical protein